MTESRPTPFARTLRVGGASYEIASLAAAEERFPGLRRLPVSLKVLAENLLRHLGTSAVDEADLSALAARAGGEASAREVAFYPARVLMPDSSGVPLVADLAAMRDAVVSLGGSPAVVNPQIPVDVVVDHSVAVDVAGSADAIARNMAREYERNAERYAFLRWAHATLDGLRVIPPGKGIAHQINLEYLATVVATRPGAGGAVHAMPDTLVGMDSHTPMVNALGVFGWGVGGIEAASAMLGEPIAMLVPPVVGCRLVGSLRPGVTCTDLVLTVVERLRAVGVVGTFVEFFGPALARLRLEERATLANMAPEYGATMGFFPIDAETVRYLRLTGRAEPHVALVEAYARAQGLWHDPETVPAGLAKLVEIDLGEVQASLAGPRRPHERIPLAEAGARGRAVVAARPGPARAAAATTTLPDGAVVVAAITSCTNTSNPSVMVAAGLLARNAVRLGLRPKPWVKTSLSPGSRVVSDYLARAGLSAPLEALGFHVVGYGCMTCGGLSGPLRDGVAEAAAAEGTLLAAVLSGNRNFEGRIHPLARVNYLASPPLVVAYALAGTVTWDPEREPLGQAADGRPVFLRDVWPSDAEIAACLDAAVTPDLFRARYADIETGDERWDALPRTSSPTYPWPEGSTYLKRPPFLDGLAAEPAPLADIRGARILVMLGDNVTTDHISPAGDIPAQGLAGRYLLDAGVTRADFNSFVSRRANHEVMARGTFANIQLRNELVPEREGGFTRHLPSGEVLPVYEAALRYAAAGVPLVVVAGRDYGAGSSRDWAAKGPRILGVRAVVAEGFERIHRSNLVGMGVLPVQLPAGVTRKTLGLRGDETFDLLGLAGGVTPRMPLTLVVHRADGSTTQIEVQARVDTMPEAEWFRHGGILPYTTRRLARGTRS